MQHRMLPHHFAITQSTYHRHIQPWYDKITTEVLPQVQAIMQLEDQYGQFPHFWELMYPMNRALVLQFDGGYQNNGLLSTCMAQWAWLQDRDIAVEPTNQEYNHVKFINVPNDDTQNYPF